MSRTIPIQHSFVTGEISPFLLGRTDLAKYAHSCESLVNFIVKVQGGIVRRPGTLAIHNPALGPGKLIPFIFSAQESFVLYFTDNALYIYTKNPSETKVITSPYRLADDIQLLKYTQIEDTMYLVHPKYPVQKLNRLPGNNWVMIQPRFLTEPATQQNEDISNGFVRITAFGTGSSGFVGKGVITIHTSSDYLVWFTNANVGAHITTADGGDATILSVVTSSAIILPDHPFQTGYTSVNVNINNAFASSSYATWNLSGFGPVGPPDSISVTGGTVPQLSQVFFLTGILMKGDIGRVLIAGTGRAVIMDVGGIAESSETYPDLGYTNGFSAPRTAQLFPQATISIIDPFDKLEYAAGEWFIFGGPGGWFSPGELDNDPATTPAGESWHGSNQFGEGFVTPVLCLEEHPTDASFEESSGTAYVHLKYTGGFMEAFRTTDIGRYVVFAGGYGIIMAVNSPISVDIIIKTVPTVTESDAQGSLLIAPSAPGSWYFEDRAFSEDNGYPGAIAFFQDRIWLGGTDANPQTIWSSGIDDLENFAKGVLDHDGIEITIAAGTFDRVLWMQPYQGNIVLGTYKSEFILSGSGLSTLGQNTTAITPTNANVTFQSAYGVTNVQPQIVQEVLLYVQRSQLNVFQMEFNIQNALYTSKDLNILNDLVTSTPIIEMAYQHSPFKVAWFIAADSQLDDNGNNVGKDLIGLTYDRVQDVFAWHRHNTGMLGQDSFVSICSKPGIVNGAVSDELWALTKRIQPDDSVAYFIELFDNSVYADFCEKQVLGSPANSITFAHIPEGTFITVVADGAPLGLVTLDAGRVYTFPVGYLATTVYGGIPYESKAITVRPELAGGGKGTIQGLIKRWVKIWARIYQSYGITINGEFVPTMAANVTKLSKPPDLFTGDISVINLGYDRDGRVVIIQSFPAPANVLALFGQMTIGEN